MVTCHGCHGPIGQGQHQGSELGKLKCNLPHSLYCRGGVLEDESWRGCPLGYQYNPSIDLASNGVGFERTMHSYEFQSQHQPYMDPAFSTPATGGSQGARAAHQLPPFPTSLRSISPAERIPSRIYVAPQSSDPEPTQDQAQSQYAPNLRGVPGNIQDKISEHRAANQVGNETCSRPLGEFSITDLRRDTSLRVEVENTIENIRQQVPSLSAADSAGPFIPNTVPQNPSPYQPSVSQSSRQADPGGVQRPVIVQNFRQQDSQIYRPAVPQPAVPQPAVPQQQNQSAPHYLSDNHHYQARQQGPLIHQGQMGLGAGSQEYEVRAEHRQQGVGHYLPDSVQSASVHLDHQGVGAQLPQARSVQQQQPYQAGTQQYAPDPLQDRTIQYCYEWVPDGSGNRVLFRTPIKHPGPPVVPHVTNIPGQHIHWAQPSYQFSPNPVNQQHQSPSQHQRKDAVLFRTEYRCCPKTGRQWSVEVPVTPPANRVPPTPKPTVEWRIHPHTGVAYQVEILPQSSPVYQQPVVPPPQGRPQNQFQGQQPIIDQTDVSQQQPTVLQHSDNQPNISSLPQGDRVAGIVSISDAGVTKNPPKILDHSKKCPTRWAKQATMSNINLPLYAWGAVSELESSISGRAGAMSENTVLGKLRHLKNVMEVCCLNSASTDFTSYGWVLARDYALKVENEVEQRLVTWDEMSVGVRTSTVLAAQMENPRTVEPPKKPVKSGKDTCTTFNKCTTAGKCEYEVQNPEKTCQRRHECSWCKTNKGQSYNHQVWKCKSKEAANQGS